MMTDKELAETWRDAYDAQTKRVTRMVAVLRMTEGLLTNVPFSDEEYSTAVDDILAEVRECLKYQMSPVKVDNVEKLVSDLRKIISPELLDKAVGDEHE